jgi:beta-N-acetylhexosaminidase
VIASRPQQRLAVLVLCLATGVAGCALTGASGAGHAAARAPAASGSAVRHDSARQRRALALLASLTPGQLAGQRVIYSYRGLTPPASLLRWIRAGKAGGVIFFGPNIAGRDQIARVIARLDRANASRSNPLRSLPLLLMTDQEGGVVRRLPGAPRLSQKQIGASAHPVARARAAGAGAGRNLAAAGMNVNLAPVLDVYRAAGGFDDQFGRSYSTDPAAVARLGRAFIGAQQAVGVAATAKHFPGLGAASRSQNTDLRPVTLHVSRRDLRAADESPYRAAIAAGVKLIMASWAVYPALAPGSPAGLSRAIVGGELRQRLGFTGVTITDAIEAGALAPFGTIPHRALRAARAGMDLILCSAQDPAEGRQVRVALAGAYGGGNLSKNVFQAAVQRILTLKTGVRR